MTLSVLVYTVSNEILTIKHGYYIVMSFDNCNNVENKKPEDEQRTHSQIVTLQTAGSVEPLPLPLLRQPRHRLKHVRHDLGVHLQLVPPTPAIQQSNA